MNEHNILLGKIAELSQFLSENGHSVWANRLRDLIARPEAQASFRRLRTDVRQLFGAMGSLTDIDVYFENDLLRTKAANVRLNKLLNDLFESANDEATTRK